MRQLVFKAHVERDAKLAQSVAGELKRGATKDDVMRQLHENLTPMRASQIWNLSQAKA